MPRVPWQAIYLISQLIHWYEILQIIQRKMHTVSVVQLQWRHNERHGVSNHQGIDYLFNRLSRRRSMKTSRLRVTGLCEGNPPVTGGLPSQKASAERGIFFHLMTSSSYIWNIRRAGDYVKVSGTHFINREIKFDDTMIYIYKCTSFQKLLFNGMYAVPGYYHNIE